MSKSLDLVRSIYAHWERGDFSSVGWADPAIEFTFIDGPEPGRWTGIEQMAAAWRRVLGDFEGFRTESARYEELGDGRILALTRFRGRAKRSGLDLRHMPRHQAAVFTVRGPKVVGIELCWDASRVLADLGSEEVGGVQERRDRA
jgi:ketosteroid isomerase-like protein